MENMISEMLARTNAAEILRKKLEENGIRAPKPSDPLYQVLIAPMAVMHGATVEELATIWNSFTLATEGIAPDKTYDDETLRHILNNLLIAPVSGRHTKGNIVLTFKDTNTRVLNANTLFIDSFGNEFYPDTNYTLTPSIHNSSASTAEIRAYTSNYVDNTYSVEIAIVSKETKAISVAEGDSFTASISGAISAVASNAFEEGAAVASLQTLLKNLPNSFSERSLASPAGVVALLSDHFPGVGISVFRSGAPEVVRDRFNLLSVKTPAADIYVTSAVTPQVRRVHLPFARVSFRVEQGTGEMFNGSTLVGHLSDADLPGFLNENTSDPVAVTGSVSSRELRGAYCALAAMRSEVVSGAFPSSDPTTRRSNGVRIVDRIPVEPGAYGNVEPIIVTDSDLAFSAYQGALVVDVDVFAPDLFSSDLHTGLREKAIAFYSYWQAWWTYTNAETSEERNAAESEMSLHASTFSGTVPLSFSVVDPLDTDILFMPRLADVQSLVNAPERRAFQQDLLVRAPVPAPVRVSITLNKTLTDVRFKENYFRTKLADAINARNNVSSLSSASLLELIFDELPATANRFASVVCTCDVLLPNGDIHALGGTEIVLPTIPELGVTPENTLMYTVPSAIRFTYS